MSDLRKAAQQALEALEAGPDVDPIFAGETEDALRAALAQEQPEPAQEPVGEMRLSEIIDGMVVPVVPAELPVGTKLYAAPPQRPPLTDEEPVGWMNPANGECISKARREAWERDYGLGGKGNAARFTVALGPIRAQRPPLTDEEIDAITRDRWGTQLLGVMVQAHREYARAIERKVRGK